MFGLSKSEKKRKKLKKLIPFVDGNLDITDRCVIAALEGLCAANHLSPLDEREPFTNYTPAENAIRDSAIRIGKSVASELIQLRNDTHESLNKKYLHPIKPTGANKKP